ncbi:MAG: choice-of-anchor Q domain-containing protein [Nitrolancea sp.]
MTLASARKRRGMWFIAALLIATYFSSVLAIAPAGAVAPTILYVNAAVGSPGNGTSWGVAYANVQDALTFATTNSGTQYEIWVAQGDYKPTTTSDRTISFVFPNNVSAFGGFAGTEAARTDRDPTANVTILDGDIGTTGSNTDNSYRVVTFGASVGNANVLDGFTIENGNANEPINIGNPFAQIADSGAGVYVPSAVAPTLSNLEIMSNHADNVGGGIYSNNASPWADHLFVHGNNAPTGGGIGTSGGAPWFQNTIISGNTGSHGGGLYVGDGNAFRLVNSIISGNRAVTQSPYSGQGAGVYFYGSTSAITPTIINSTITGNYSEGTTGGVSASSFVSPHIDNSIVWNNADPNGNTGASEFSHDVFGGSTYITSSIVQGGCPTGSHMCTNVIDADPMFMTPVDPTTAPTTNGDFRLGTFSPAIDAGDNSLVPGTITTDILGNPRIFDYPLIASAGAVVDMGPYEAMTPQNTANVSVYAWAIGSPFGHQFSFFRGTFLSLNVRTGAGGAPLGSLTYSSGLTSVTSRTFTTLIYDNQMLVVVGQARLFNGQMVTFQFTADLSNQGFGGAVMRLTLSNGYDSGDIHGLILVN